MNTPVDFEQEVGGDNTPAQARVLGIMAGIYGTFIASLLFIPNPIAGRLGILGCAATLWGVAATLLLYSRFKHRSATESHDSGRAIGDLSPQPQGPSSHA